MLLAELVVARENRAQRVRGVLPGAVLDVAAVREEEAEAFLREREEDVVLAREVAVDGGRAVFDLVRDLRIDTSWYP
jgi:hypothetical protein